MAGVPIGILPINSLCATKSYKNNAFRFFILFFTFCVYTTYHLSRRPISVVKNVLYKKNCSDNETLLENVTQSPLSPCSWAPFDDPSTYGSLFGGLDSAFLFSYAIGVFISGQIAERMDLRYFLTIGMLGTGLFTCLFGVGRYLSIHTYVFFVICQILAGLLQSTGWPSVVACVANWFGKGKRGFIMGVWNSHTSVGNILGAIIAGAFVNYNWGLSFIVPGLIIGGMGVLVFLFLIPYPHLVGCSPPDHHGDAKSEESKPLVEEELSESENHQGEPAVRPQEAKAISFTGALRIPGVVEFSLCLFFAKLVSYTFLFWLPKYIKATETGDVTPEQAADLSTFFDLGGIVGGISAGLVSDITGGRATTCLVMLALGAPMLYIYQAVGYQTYVLSVVTLLVTGFFVNGPYALITTAVSADLGTHQCLRGNAKALATVTAIIDGTGSIGAAIGPLLTGLIINVNDASSKISANGNWIWVFVMLMISDVLALLLLARLVAKEIKGWVQQCRSRRLAVQHE